MEGYRMRFLLILAAALVTASAYAQTAPTGFQSPSKNIACAYFDYDKQNTLRCDIAVMDNKPRRPPGCDLEYGQAFEMSAIGAAARICYGDTVIDKDRKSTRLNSSHRMPSRMPSSA